jgi:hypothetical protein
LGIKNSYLLPIYSTFKVQKLGCSDKTPSGRKGKDLDYYWKGAVKNLDKELELYKHDVESMRDREIGGRRGQEGNNPSTSLSITIE